MRECTGIARKLCALAIALFCVSGVSSAQDPGASTEPEYVIGVEDKLTVSVWREPDLMRTVTVRPDGKITFPLIGDIQAAGRSPQALDDQITTAIGRFIKEPVVTVIVEEINSFRVYVLGEVHTQGVQLLKQKTRLLQGLALAGGLTQYADRSNVVIVREEQGREVRLRIDYRKVISGERPDQNQWLKPGDTIIVN